MKAEFNVGLAHKLCVAWAAQNGTPAELNTLAETPERVVEFLSVLRGRARVVVNPILTFLRVVHVPPHLITTTSKEYFAEVGVWWTGTNFESQFIGLEVMATSEAELVVRRLEEDSFDALIMTELGDKVGTSVSHFADFLGSHRESKGVFIFYLRGKDGKLWAVDVRWYAAYDGWYVDAYSVTRPSRWTTGCQVVSRN